MIEWLADNAWWPTVVGALMFVCGAGVLCVLAVTMPADHFMRRPRSTDETRRHPALRLLVRVLRNVAGAVLVALGLVMIVPLVPGPGVLFILLGVSLTDMPGKRALARYIVSRPLVFQPLNAIRARWNRPPVQIPHDQR